MQSNKAFRTVSLAAALAAVLVSSSCVSGGDEESVSADPVENHPITVEPQYKTLELSFATPAAGLLPQDEARFDAFVDNYLTRGNGSVSVSVPEGPSSAAAIKYFGDRLAEMGVPHSEILVGTRQIENGDPRIKLGYIAYTAGTSPCGDWPNATITYSNRPMPNLGCATQHNLAAMVTDPRDLSAPRTMGPADATRRSDVMQKYESGQSTASQKTGDQTISTTSSQ